MSPEPDWSAATWEGSRRAMIRRALRLTVRERLEALEALTETSAGLGQGASSEPPAETDQSSTSATVNGASAPPPALEARTPFARPSRATACSDSQPPTSGTRPNPGENPTP